MLDQDVSAFGAAKVEISIEDDTVRFDYTTMIGDPDVILRAGVARYGVQGSHAVRQAPIAASFGGFIDEWLGMDDPGAAHWSTRDANIRHHDLAARFKKEYLFSWEHAAACPGPPPAREIAIQWSESKQTSVFLISGSTAAEMRMLSVSDKRSPSCRQIDISADRSSILAEPPR